MYFPDINGSTLYKLKSFNSSEITTSYARMYVSNELPSNPQGNELVYLQNSNELYKYDVFENKQVKIDQQKYIVFSPEYSAGYLRINNNVLQISSDKTNQYNCIPAIGANTIELLTIDNTLYSYKYQILPGQTVIIRNANHVPICYTHAINPFFECSYYHTHAYKNWVGLRPSNFTVSGFGQWLITYTSIVQTADSVLNIVPVIKQSVNENCANFELRIINTNTNQKFFINSIGQTKSGTGLAVCNSSATVPISSYWLGTWYNQAGYQFSVIMLVLTRRA